MSEWISVKDKLPERNIPKNPLECEKSKEFLVFTSEKEIRMGYFHQGKMKIMCDYCGEGCEATHYMPLPEPPND